MQSTANHAGLNGDHSRGLGGGIGGSREDHGRRGGAMIPQNSVGKDEMEMLPLSEAVLGEMDAEEAERAQAVAEIKAKVGQQRYLE